MGLYAAEENIASKVTETATKPGRQKENSSMVTSSHQPESSVMTFEKPLQQDQNNTEDKSEKKKRPLSSSIRAIQARLLNSCPNEVAQELEAQKRCSHVKTKQRL